MRRCLAWLIVAGGLTAATGSPAGATGYHVGLDFIQSPVASIPPLGNYGFNPFCLCCQENYFVQDGGLAGWTEARARRGVAMAIDDAFRAVDTGDPDTTLRVQIHVEPVPPSTPGRRVNVIMGASQDPSLNALGYSVWSGAFNETQYPNDSYTGVAYLDELDDLRNYDPLLRFTTSESVFNNIGGTTAHEVGHNFELIHVDRGSTQPYPTMATVSTGLTIMDRLTVRHFDDTPGTQQGGHSSESHLVSRLGTVNRADFDMSDVIDSGDASIINANWLLADRLFQEGDANGDHTVDSDDVSAINANWRSMYDLPALGTGSASYDPATGEILVSGNGLCSIGIVSPSHALDEIGPVHWQHNFGTLKEDARPWRVIESVAGGNMPDFEDHLFFTAPAGIPEGAFDLQLRYQALSEPLTLTDVVYVPEPGTIVMLGIAVLGLLSCTRRLRR